MNNRSALEQISQEIAKFLEKVEKFEGNHTVREQILHSRMLQEDIQYALKNTTTDEELEPLILSIERWVELEAAAFQKKK